MVVSIVEKNQVNLFIVETKGANLGKSNSMDIHGHQPNPPYMPHNQSNSYGRYSTQKDDQQHVPGYGPTGFQQQVPPVGYSPQQHEYQNHHSNTIGYGQLQFGHQNSNNTLNTGFDSPSNMTGPSRSPSRPRSPSGFNQQPNFDQNHSYTQNQPNFNRQNSGDIMTFNDLKFCSLHRLPPSFH